jgi:hypothetical protein
MTNENNVTVIESNSDVVVTVEAAPKRTLAEATETRLTFERNSLAEKQAYLLTCKPGSKAHARCLASIAKVEALIKDICAKRDARVAKAAAKLAAAAANAPAAPAVQVA